MTNDPLLTPEEVSMLQATDAMLRGVLGRMKPEKCIPGTFIPTPEKRRQINIVEAAAAIRVLIEPHPNT